MSLDPLAPRYEGVPEGAVAPERLRQVFQRLEQGFYESADVRDEIARRATADLGWSKPR